LIGWLRRWGWVVGVVAVAVLIWILSRGKAQPPTTELKAAVDAARAEAKAEKLAATIGHREAVKRIEEEYRDSIQKLEKKEQEQVEELKQDPGRLARLLARDASRRRQR
jgi:flagellar biosynthesis/type III secretory pathway M-ring protein FliF/YscJ